MSTPRDAIAAVDRGLVEALAALDSGNPDRVRRLLAGLRVSARAAMDSHCEVCGERPATSEGRCGHCRAALGRSLVLVRRGEVSRHA